MINNPLSIDAAIKTLNESYKEDSSPCIGLLGIINGLFGTFDDGLREGWGPITAVIEKNDGSIIRFERTINKSI